MLDHPLSTSEDRLLLPNSLLTAHIPYLYLPFVSQAFAL